MSEAKHDTDDEIRELFDNLAAYDQSLTEEQRKVYRAQERGDRYLERLGRMKVLLSQNAPRYVLALAARHLYLSACGLWPEEMSKVVGNEFIERIRKRTGRCLMCGKDLSYATTNAHCDECEANLDEMTKE